MDSTPVHGTTEEVPRSRTPIGKKEKNDPSGQGETWDWLQLEMAERLTTTNNRQQQIPMKEERPTPTSTKSGDSMEANPPTQERIEEDMATAAVAPDMPTMGGEERTPQDIRQLDETIQKLKAEIIEIERKEEAELGVKAEIKEEPEDQCADDKERMKEQLAAIEAELKKLLTTPADVTEKTYPCSLKWCSPPNYNAEPDIPCAVCTTLQRTIMEEDAAAYNAWTGSRSNQAFAEGRQRRGRQHGYRSNTSRPSTNATTGNGNQRQQQNHSQQLRQPTGQQQQHEVLSTVLIKCCFFSRHGRCWYGDQCKFVHHVEHYTQAHVPIGGRGSMTVTCERMIPTITRKYPRRHHQAGE